MSAPRPIATVLPHSGKRRSVQSLVLGRLLATLVNVSIFYEIAFQKTTRRSLLPA